MSVRSNSVYERAAAPRASSGKKASRSCLSDCLLAVTMAAVKVALLNQKCKCKVKVLS